MEITPEEKLLEYADGIELINADFDIPKSATRIYFSSDGTPKRFFNFCRNHGINCCFYYVLTKEVGEKRIYEYEIEDLDKSSLRGSNEKQAFWEIMREAWLDRPEEDDEREEVPSYLQMMALYNGAVIEYEEEDEDAEEDNLEILEKYIELHRKEIDRKVTEVEAKTFQLFNDLKAEVLDDETFLRCTNQRKRGLYAHELMRSDKYKSLSYFTYKGKPYNLRDLIEQIYDEYKLQCRKNNVSLGNKLPKGVNVEIEI